MKKRGTCISYDSNTIFIRAKTEQDEEFLLNFFKTFGIVLNKEKHGIGPLHHSCEKNGKVLEIYPPGNK